MLFAIDPAIALQIEVARAHTKIQKYVVEPATLERNEMFRDCIAIPVLEYVPKYTVLRYLDAKKNTSDPK